MGDPTGRHKTTTHHSHQRPQLRKNRKPHPPDPPPATSGQSQPGRAGQHPQGPPPHATAHHPRLSLRQPTPKEGAEQCPQKPPRNGHGPPTTKDGGPATGGGLETTPTPEHTPTTQARKGSV